MLTSEVEARIVELVRSRYPKLQIENPGTASFQELGIDSIELLNLVFEIEDKFGIAISNEALAEVRTTDALTRLVADLVAEAGSNASGG